MRKRRGAPSAASCPCGWEGVNLSMHYTHSPLCRPDESAPPRARDPTVSSNTFAARVHSFVDKEVWSAHTNHFLPIAHCEIGRVMMMSIVHFVVSFIMVELRAQASTPTGLTLESGLELCDTVLNMLKRLPTADTIITQYKNNISVQPLLRGGNDEDKKCISFSIVQLLTVMLQESKTVREHVIASSERWKTGELYQKSPNLYADVTDGSRFRNSPVCKKATPAEKKDLRIQLHLWNDAFTSVNGMGPKAKQNKWDITLASIVNLPIRLRHYFDHLLLLAIFQHVWGVANGGVAKVLCGVDEEGNDLVTASDCLTLRSEIRASRERKITITLPDDCDPGNEEGVTMTLIIYVGMISLDWLANGAFGPFAEAVSANLPCFKCRWTDTCGCAWIARSEQRNDTLLHTSTCQQRRSRTHNETLQVIREMRAMNETDLKKAKTKHGIFSTVFASEYLLDDIIKDATVDVMHVFLASGLVPYVLSWLFDVMIPDEFTWVKLDYSITAYNAHRKGQRIPKLRASAKGDRAAAKLPITAAEAKEIVLGNEQLFGDLVSNTTSPHWVCWLKLVKLVRFVLRRQFSLHDPDTVQSHYDAFMRSFEMVPQWTGYWKPKHHLGDHLKDALAEHGPFRAYWCMWGEAFLQYLKHLFEMTNYKSAAYTVSVLWAAKAKERYRDPNRILWHQDTVTPRVPDDFLPISDLSPPMTPPMVEACRRDTALTARHLSSFKRSSDEIFCHDWVLASIGTLTVVGRISELVELHVISDGRIASVVRVLLQHVVVPSFDSHDLLTVACTGGQCMCLPLEASHVTAMACQQHTDRLHVRLRVL